MNDVHRAATALVVVDLQNCYFKDADLKLTRESVVSNCTALIRRALDADVPVVQRSDRTSA